MGSVNSVQTHWKVEMQTLDVAVVSKRILNKLPEANTPSIKRYSHGQPYFTCLGAIPKQMSTCFFNPIACFTCGIINHSATAKVYLRREDVAACFPCKSYQFVRDIKAPNFHQNRLIISLVEAPSVVVFGGIMMATL